MLGCAIAGCRVLRFRCMTDVARRVQSRVRRGWLKAPYHTRVGWEWRCYSASIRLCLLGAASMAPGGGVYSMSLLWFNEQYW